MGPTVFAWTPYKNRKNIWMKDTTQMGILDFSVYGWPEIVNQNGNSLNIGGFAFSKVDTYPPKMYFGTNSSLVYVNYPSNGTKTVIRNGYVRNPVHLDVQNEGGQDVIYFCTREGYYKYNFQTSTEEKLVNFQRNDWKITLDKEIAACVYLRSVDRIILIMRDKVGVWGKPAGDWIPLFTPKKRFWYPYQVRLVELGNMGYFILYSKHTFMVLDSATLSVVNVWDSEWDWTDWGT